MDSVTKRIPIPRNGVDYRGRIVLAPMVRSGELPSRLLALHYGADLVWGPETVDRSIIGTSRTLNPSLSTIDFTRLPSHGHNPPSKSQKESLIYRIHPSRESAHLIFQLGTSNPFLAVAAARLVAPHVAGIDVNAGCPKPFSTSGGMGAALLRTPDTLCAILAALVRDVSAEFEIGISVKIRLLETPCETEALVRRLVATGITGLTVHCRMTAMRPRERAVRDQLRMVAGICREAGVACLMNGDVASRTEAEDLIDEFGVDGAMIATAAESNPSCFRTEEEGGLAPWREVVERYVATAMEVENRFGNTKYLLGHLIPGKDAVYRGITGTRCYREVCEILGFEGMVERAKEVDERLELNVKPKLQGKKGVQQQQQKKKNKNDNKTAMAAGGKMARTEAEGRKALSARGVQGVLNQNQQQVHAVALNT